MNPLSPWLLWHAYPALAAVLIGIVIMARPKGTASHRLAGRLWVALMEWAAGGFALFSPTRMAARLIGASIY